MVFNLQRMGAGLRFSFKIFKRDSIVTRIFDPKSSTLLAEIRRNAGMSPIFALVDLNLARS
jgi:hypothetical protein